MINFIICEDERVLALQYKKEIDKFMMKYDNEYKCKFFDGYNDEWKIIAKKNLGFKIYILDIKTKEGSGIDAARLIREEYDDWNSMIIIVTSYTEYKYDALSKRLMLVDFINKLDNCSKQLQEAFSICMKHYDKRPKALKYSYKNTVYNIDFKQITYIEKEFDSKRCIIHTLREDVPYPGTLNQLLSKLDNRFVKCSRAMVVNLEQIKFFDTKLNEITFKNEQTFNEISRSMKKGLIRRVRGLK